MVFGQTAADLEPAGIPENRFVYSPALAEKTLRGVDDVVSAWHGAEKGRITCVVAAHAPEACSPELLRGARELAERRDVRTTIHLDQSHWEVAVRHAGPRRAAGRVPLPAGLPLARLVAAHCRFMSPGEISHLGRSRASVSHNAAMAARRAAAPPIQALAAAGCNIAMGTDNMAHDMLEAMRTGLFVERISRQDGERPWPEDVLEWGTRNGAAALGLGAEVGSLEVGKKADLIILDARRPHLVPALRIVSAWIHNGQAGDVESVMVDGALAHARPAGADDRRGRRRHARGGDRPPRVAAARGAPPERPVPDHASARRRNSEEPIMRDAPIHVPDPEDLAGLQLAAREHLFVGMWNAEQLAAEGGPIVPVASKGINFRDLAGTSSSTPSAACTSGTSATAGTRSPPPSPASSSR